MQEPTHILAGILIQRAFEPVRPRALGLGLTAVCAFLSHGLLDRLANATYHPPNANFHDPSWVCFHSSILLLTIAFLMKWWRRWKWGIFFACLPDLDWVFVHGQEIFHFKHPIYTKPYMHRFLNEVFNRWLHLSKLQVPNHRMNVLACLWEVALVLLMLGALHLLNKRQRAIVPRPT